MKSKPENKNENEPCPCKKTCCDKPKIQSIDCCDCEAGWVECLNCELSCNCNS